jgi:Carbohydrate esterase, sialic acid-specific acetylesterase
MKSLRCSRSAISTMTLSLLLTTLLPLTIIIFIIAYHHSGDYVVVVATNNSTTIPGNGSNDCNNNNINNNNIDMVVKVFILAGQSNMVGMASIEHLQELIIQNASSPPHKNAHDDEDRCRANEYCKDLWNVETNAFKIRQNVFIKYNDVHGNLTVGHGFAGDNRFGPELGFGWVVGGSDDSDDADDDDNTDIIYIIKAAWGGRTLAVDFRPPASGEGNYDNVKPHTYGWEYRAMIDSIAQGLDQIGNVIPGYNNSNGSSFEIAGFVWFQGWNDMLNMPMVMEYGYNLMNFLRDVRQELDTPNLPVVVGELGMHGAHYT